MLLSLQNLLNEKGLGSKVLFGSDCSISFSIIPTQGAFLKPLPAIFQMNIILFIA